jgi:RNA polymerase sigma-70 factor (ECF subfamily)
MRKFLLSRIGGRAKPHTFIMDAKESTGSPAHEVSRDQRAATGDDLADLGEFLSAHRDRLRRMVALRLDERLRGRIDPSDVIQEAFLEATERHPEYVRQPDRMPPFLWLRFLTLQRLQIIHRRQLATQARDPMREVPIHALAFPAATSAAIAAQLLGHDTRASEAAIRSEERRQVQDALDRMDPVDREVLVLRHFEQLSNGECARVMGLGESAAIKRYFRALRRLRDVLSNLPGGNQGARP